MPENCRNQSGIVVTCCDALSTDVSSYSEVIVTYKRQNAFGRQGPEVQTLSPRPKVSSPFQFLSQRNGEHCSLMTAPFAGILPESIPATRAISRKTCRNRLCRECFCPVDRCYPTSPRSLEEMWRTHAGLCEAGMTASELSAISRRQS